MQNIKLSDDEDRVVILDQTQLPNRTGFIGIKTADEMYDAIKTLKVRGAPAIGIFAAYGLYILAKQTKTDDYTVFCETHKH